MAGRTPDSLRGNTDAGAAGDPVRVLLDSLAPFESSRPAAGLGESIRSVLSRLRRMFFNNGGRKKFHLHVGAHKTGTTYVQTALRINGEKLGEERIAYWDLHTTRKQLTPLLQGLSGMKAQQQRKACENSIGALIRSPRIRSARKVLISDENLLGFASEIVRKKGYRRLAGRMAPIRRALGNNVKVFLTVRNYPDFISSVYCELITYKPWIPFDEVREDGMMANLSWLAMYRDLAKVFGASNVIVCDYQSVFSHPMEYLSLLTGAEIDFEFPENEIRVSPSARAVEFIGGQQSGKPGQNIRKIAWKAMAKFPKGPENPAFDPWTPEERERLMERYRNDLREIPLRTFGGAR